MESNLTDRTYNYVFELEIKLKNISPLRIGTGEDEKILLTEDNKSLIFGSSICGAVKSYLMNVHKKEKVEKFFGYTKEEDDGNGGKKEVHIESKIYFSDMISNKDISGKRIERDGIRVNTNLGSTLDKGKYKSVFIEKGNEYKLRIKVFIDIKEAEGLKDLLKSIVNGINKKQILFGADKTKGFGVFEVTEANYIEFDLKKDMESYLKRNILKKDEMESFDYENRKILDELGNISFTGDIKDSFLLKGEMKSETYKDSNGKNKTKKVQYSYEEGENKYIIPSGTIKGSMRAYIEKILNTIEHNKKEKLITDLFGHKAEEKEQKNYKMGKLIIEDCQITKIKDLEKIEETEYHRIKIDRFTGGAINGALINEKRLVKGEVNLKFRIRKCLNDDEKALILLYLRDLGLGKIVLGSNGNVGSGRINGKSIEIDGIKIDLNNMDTISEKSKTEINKWFEELKKEVKA